MTTDLKKLGLFAEITGAAGIIISMLYLGYQVSQNTANIQAANALAISSELSAHRAVHIENRDAHDLIYKAWTDYDSLDDSEKTRFTAYALNRISIWENLVLMDNEGLLPEGFAEPAEASICALMNLPAFRSVWKEWAVEYSSAQLTKRVDACLEAD